MNVDKLALKSFEGSIEYVLQSFGWNEIYF